MEYRYCDTKITERIYWNANYKNVYLDAKGGAR